MEKTENPNTTLSGSQANHQLVGANPDRSRNSFKLLLYAQPLLWIGCIFFPLVTEAQIAQTGAISEQSGDTAGTFAVWAVPAEQKVRPNDPVEDDNLVWSQADRKVTLAGAGNEHVPFQVVLTVPPPRRDEGKEAAMGFFVEATALTSANGATIPASQIKFYLEHYIFLDAASSPVGNTGYWPDALVPVKVPFGMTAQYDIIKNRPVWVDVVIPSSAQPGHYKGTLTILKDGKALKSVGLELHVYAFTLPENTPLITYMNISKDWLARFYHKPVESPEVVTLTQTYYDFLYANRMEPWFNDMLLPVITVTDKNVTVKFDDARYAYYMNKLHTKRVLLEALPGSLRRQVTDQPFTPAFNQKVKSYLSQVEGYFSKHGWKERLVFNSPIDEPRSEEDYEKTRQWARLVHEATPGVPFLATRTPVPPKEHPEWGTLRGSVDNFSIHGNHLNDPEVKRAIREEHAKGGEMSWYISCDQGYPQPNYFIDAPALDPVMVPWITARYDMDGVLYWALNFWSQTANPWLNANTFHSGFLCSGGWVLNGEGSLLYPGDYAEQYTGQPNVDGPVTSIRFELLREGIEDFVYLSMLERSGQQAVAESILANMVIDVSAFSRNLEELYSARKTMATTLESVGR